MATRYFAERKYSHTCHTLVSKRCDQKCEYVQVAWNVEIRIFSVVRSFPIMPTLGADRSNSVNSVHPLTRMAWFCLTEESVHIPIVTWSASSTTKRVCFKRRVWHRDQVTSSQHASPGHPSTRFVRLVFYGRGRRGAKSVRPFVQTSSYNAGTDCWWRKEYVPILQRQ